MDLVDSLIKKGYLKTPEIIDAFKSIKRADFLPKNIAHLSELDEALPIGENQTISQPLTVAFMLELLSPEKGNKILDIGSGSGWTTALLSHIVGERGKVFALEVIPELSEFGKNNVSKYNFVKKGIASFFISDGKEGYRKEAPYDRILCSASSGEIPLALKEQMKIGGKMVIPAGSSIFFLEKEEINKFREEEYPGFAFVPLK